MSKFKYLFFSLVFGASAITSQAQTKPNLTAAMFGSYSARQIGPAVMSGRITAIDAVNNNARIIYVGTGGGGVWKSTNAGTSFKPIFDKYSQSIGCLIIDQKNPETIWVGTGESNMRNSVSVGTGLYKSKDGGSNWRYVGLDSTEHISKIALHPTDENIVYVSVPGPLWSDSKHRGLYKTTDGGKTWNKILFIDNKTGCADVIIDPKNPETIYASTWEFRRTPWSFNSGGKGSGLYKSTDGGKTWNKIQNGFEGDIFGRICLAMSPSDPNQLYAIAESKNTGLYASKDGGATWTRKSATQNVTWRPFYFAEMKIDPTDSKRIYRPGLSFSFSTDGGESWKDATSDGGWVHSDHHAIWINPNNSNHLLLGTDGGVYQSLDKGNSWTMFKNLPVSQFYHVSYDMQTPYNVYGGLQDNGSWFAPVQSPNGIENKDWTNCGGGDGFWVQPDRGDNNIVYSESQGGNITRFNKLTNESKDIKPYQLAGEPKMRCNWNTPIVTSPTNPNTLYFASQFLYRSKNKGISWEKISGDLTTNNPKKQEQEKSGGLSVDNSGAENHCTIFTIAESPKDENLIWVGTDDGNVQVTTDGGKTWTNVTLNVKGLPLNTWCSSIDASTYDKNTAFATFEGHATGDMKPYVYKTTDMGKTWTALQTNDIVGFAHKVKQDIVNPNLLFVGTEFGLFVSLDAGASWMNYTSNVPKTPVRDIAIHPVTNDLILATHGRGILIVDDITPIRKVSRDLLDVDVQFMPCNPTYLNSIGFGGAFPSDGYSGENSDDSYKIVYWLNKRVTKGNVDIEVYDANNIKVATIPGTKRKGLNMATWNLSGKPPRVAKGVKADFSGFIGAPIIAGKYKLKLKVNDKVIEQDVDILNDPKSPYTNDEIKIKTETFNKVFKLQEDLAFLSEKIRALNDSAYMKAKPLFAKDKGLEKSYNALIAKTETLLKTFAVSVEGTAITGEEQLREKITTLYYGIVSSPSRPTDMQIERVKALQLELDEANKKADAIITTDLPKVNAVLLKNKVSPVSILSYEAWDKATKK